MASDGPPVQEGGALESLGVDYDGLPDHPHSFAKEAARYALDAKVPSHSAAGYELATFAGGCFWGLELFFRSLHGVVTTAVGFSQGSTTFPTYLQVCGGETGREAGARYMCSLGGMRRRRKATALDQRRWDTRRNLF